LEALFAAALGDGIHGRLIGRGTRNLIWERTMKSSVSFDDYKVVLYRNQPGGWVAEIPSIPGCYALMETKAEALKELEEVFEMISEEYRERGQNLPADTTAIVNA
jgi:predicted RNase H-like HicB family nuclease